MKIIGDGTRARLKEGDLWSDDPVRLLTAIESAEALLEGRTTRPTDAELVKVSEAGGFWRFRMEGKEYNSERDTGQFVAALRNAAPNGSWKVRWWAHDSEGMLTR